MKYNETNIVEFLNSNDICNIVELTPKEFIIVAAKQLSNKTEEDKVSFKKYDIQYGKIDSRNCYAFLNSTTPENPQGSFFDLPYLIRAFKLGMITGNVDEDRLKSLKYGESYYIRENLWIVCMNKN